MCFGAALTPPLAPRGYLSSWLLVVGCGGQGGGWAGASSAYDDDEADGGGWAAPVAGIARAGSAMAAGVGDAAAAAASTLGLSSK